MFIFFLNFQKISAPRRYLKPLQGRAPDIYFTPEVFEGRAERPVGQPRILFMTRLWEEEAGLSKDMVYGAALLHDCGRYKQYLEGISHDEAGAKIASWILPECGYIQEEINCITGAIASHRGSSLKEREGALADILYRADKMSRNCLFCNVYEECNWDRTLKEKALYY